MGCKLARIAARFHLDRAQTLVRRFGRTSSGATAVEFGLVLFPFIATMLVIFENSLDLFMTEALDNATRKATRQIQTGAAQAGATNIGGMSSDQFRQNIFCPLLPAFMSCANVVVDVRADTIGNVANGFYKYVNTAKTALLTPVLDSTQSAFCTGTPGQYVTVRAYYGAPLLTSFLTGNTPVSVNGISGRLLSSSAAIKNEGFTPLSNGVAGC